MPPKHPTTQPRTGSSPPPDARLVYAFVVVLLAAFLSGLIVFRPPATGHEASVAIVARLRDSQPSARASGEIDGREILAVVTREALVRRALSRSVPSPNASLTAQDVAAVQRLVRVDVQHPASRVAKITITCQNSNPDRALALVDQLGREFVATRRQSGPAPADDAERRWREWASVEARHYETRAKNELDAFVHERISVAPAAASLTPPTASLSHIEPPQIDPGSEVTESSDAYRQELEARLADFTDQRAELLDRVTSEHPDVAEIEARIEELQSQLAQIPFSQTEPPAAAARVPERSASATDLPRVDADPLSGTAADHWNRLQLELEEATRRREEADTNWQRIATSPTSAEASAYDWRVEPCQLVGRTSVAPSSGRVAVIGLAAIFLAGVVTWRAQAARLYSTFSTIKEFEAAIPFPIVGRIPGDGGEAATRARTRRCKTVRTAVLVSELVVAAAVVCVSFAVLAGRPGADQLATDPFLAISRLFVNFPRAPL